MTGLTSCLLISQESAYWAERVYGWVRGSVADLSERNVPWRSISEGQWFISLRGKHSARNPHAVTLSKSCYKYMKYESHMVQDFLVTKKTSDSCWVVVNLQQCRSGFVGFLMGLTRGKAFEGWKVTFLVYSMDNAGEYSFHTVQKNKYSRSVNPLNDI